MLHREGPRWECRGRCGRPWRRWWQAGPALQSPQDQTGGTCWFLLWLSKASGLGWLNYWWWCWCWPGRGRACRWDGGETCPPGSSSLLLPHLLLPGLLLPAAGSFHAVRTSLPDVMSRSGKKNLICHHSHLFFESLPVLLLLSGRRQLHHLLLTRLWRGGILWFLECFGISYFWAS